MPRPPIPSAAALAALAFALAVPVAARSAAAQTLDLAALAEAARDSAGAPALGLVVVSPGAEPQVAVTGLRCVGSEAAVTAADLWHWGSITKSMTATLTARLVEAGEVRWDQTVGELLGGSVPDLRDAYRDVTFRHLLSHAGGLQPNIPIYRFQQFPQESDDPMADRLRWARIALTQEPVGPVGEYTYSNNGYIVAGAMLEAATGEPWEDLIRREVFEPLGMDRAGFGAPVDRDPDQPCGHIAGGELGQAVRIGGDNPAALGPAGRVHSTLADMARYLEAHASSDISFLSTESWEALHTVHFGGNYALGWVATARGQRWHNGSNTLWYAEVAFQSDGRAAIVVVNDGELGAVQPPVSDLLRRLLGDG